MMSVGQLCSQDQESASDMEDKPLALEKRASQKRRRENSPKPSDDDTNDSDDDDDLSGRSDNERGDHNRWYCNVCKDGGELLCCDRCPRAFHTACLTMDPDDVPSPDSNWYCKLCSDTLERRKAKRDVKEQRRLKREEEKRQRELAREQKQRQKDEASARRSAKALEDKAKRVLDMKERIVKKQKVTYKDREEEKLGKIAENLAETIRQAKEKLEKLEKEDLLLKKREQALTKKRGFPMEDLEVPEDEELLQKRPKPLPCDFSGLPSDVFGDLLPVWDFIYSFRDLLELSPISIEQMCSALATTDAIPSLMSEVHMALLDLILEHMEHANYAPEEEDEDMDAIERYKFQVVHAPLTVGIPTSNMLNFVSWPAVLANLIWSVPRFHANASPELLAAATGLATTDYARIAVQHKVALLRFLVTRAYGTTKVVSVVNHHVSERVEAAKEHSKMLFHEKRAAAEEDKKLKEQQRAEKARAAQDQKEAMSSWLKGGKKGPAPVEDDKSSDGHSVSSQSDNDELDSDESSGTDEEETALKELQAKGIISRQEYVTRRKKLQTDKEEKRRVRLELRKRQKQKEQAARKRLLVSEELHVAMDVRDLDRLRSSLKNARDLGMNSKRASRNGEPATAAEMKLVEDAEELLERLEADAVKEAEMEERKRAFEETMRAYFIRTEPVGKDRRRGKYWVFRGDTCRVYVQDEAHRWHYYPDADAVRGLLASLDPRGIRENHLQHELRPVLEALTKPAADVPEWRNKVRSWSAEIVPTIAPRDLQDQFVRLEGWLSKHLFEKPKSRWTTEVRDAWLASVQAATTAAELVPPLLAIEREITGVHMHHVLTDDADDEDEDEDDEEEVFYDSGLWPSVRARSRWVATLKMASTLAGVGVGLAALLQRMDLIGLSETNVAKKSIKKKEEKEEEPPKKEPEAPKAQEWEEYCCVCGDGGELLCCDGCPRVFHFPCVGLRRVPRGKTFCPHCDKSVKPVYPVVRRANPDRDSKLKAEPSADAPPVAAASGQQWDSYCTECGAGGSLLLCDGCPKAFHATCLQLDEDDLGPGEDWFCAECENQSCGQCKKGRIRMDSHVICGSEDGTRGCERVFHLKCVKLSAVPAEDWYCKKCLKTLK
ncbi:hypothetical protein ACHHYP_04610 [Achlya hypogyna]|uniref:Uncharacterized protein n=1 Tax=Achlya hypogyna TaxID=1202772 RepID=A0A1V9Z0H7_ACHHY|nr:hypothetical protein ACHHYP_04610 [Achlya hypogyna]